MLTNLFVTSDDDNATSKTASFGSYRPETNHAYGPCQARPTGTVPVQPATVPGAGSRPFSGLGRPQHTGHHIGA